MANLGVLTIFDHNLQQSDTYIGRIKQFFIANGVDDAVTDSEGTRRRAILLSALCDSTYKLVQDLALPKKLENVPYEDILSLLDAHFTPKHIGFAERHNFYAATQQLGESYAQWAARLRGLTAHCKFTNIEETLRDRFIMGMLPGQEKEKLYGQNLEEMTLAKAVEWAENLRCAKVSATASGSGDGVGHTTPLFKLQSAKKKCAVCGYTNHATDKCRFAKYSCKKCGVKGHLRRMCVNYVKTASNEGESEGDDVFTE
ncbi:uncharacterized protein LOC114357761 isoform X2 [Ostrinia furnacalis]|uniref:uncharacterized protein LOC114357761 isoform X2 n=1 Tax=Ostrinia furnacalis TaxID=93504 RepID=UPI00103ED025|nr:uncharacterized protein LOC114357761 isoform X2 [Ostrinia furnacalis]